MSKPILEGDLLKEIRDLQKQVSDIENVIQVPWEWVTPTLLNSWTQYSDPNFSQVAYRQEPSGKVTLRGGVSRNAATGSSTIFTLPEGLRPVKNQLFNCRGVHGGADSAFRVDVNSSGAVTFQGNGTNIVSYLFLDPISFWPN